MMLSIEKGRGCNPATDMKMKMMKINFMQKNFLLKMEV